MRRIFFKRDLIPLILSGEKTQTCRKIGIFKENEILRVNDTPILIKILRKRKVKLGSIDMGKEGLGLKEFRVFWENVFGRYCENEEVYVYEFELVNPEFSTQKLKNHEAKF